MSDLFENFNEVSLSLVKIGEAINTMLSRDQMSALYEILGKMLEEREHEYEHIGFAPGSVPVRVAARVYGRDQSWVRAGIISGYLNIGKAIRNGKPVTTIDEMDSKYGRISYYISPKALYEDTGYVWKGERE